MTVQDLIDKLQAFAPTDLVLVPNGEMGDEWVALDKVRSGRMAAVDWNPDIHVEDRVGTVAAVILE